LKRLLGEFESYHNMMHFGTRASAEQRCNTLQPCVGIMRMDVTDDNADADYALFRAFPANMTMPQEKFDMFVRSDWPWP
jgi:hypothetical protein